MSARTPPRFVPILTEVVHALVPDVPGPHDELVRRVAEAVLAELEPLVRETLAKQSAEQAAQQARLLDGLLADVALLVVRRVADAVQAPVQGN